MTTLRWAAAACVALATWGALVWLSALFAGAIASQPAVAALVLFLVVGGVVLTALLLANLNQVIRALGCAAAGAILLWLAASSGGHFSTLEWLMAWSMGSGTLFVVMGAGMLLGLFVKGQRRPLDE